jgi:hypothetical protein
MNKSVLFIIKINILKNYSFQIMMNISKYLSKLAIENR